MFVDIHTHILPGIDDGAADIEASIGMLDIASLEDKESCIIATPHYICGSLQNGAEKVAGKLEELKTVASDRGLKLDLRRGCEIFLSTEVPELLESGEISTLAGSSYVLVELPMMSIPEYTADVLYKLQLKGYNPIIAHPERYRDVIADPNCLLEYLQRGIHFQINASSLKGLYGKQIRETALVLLKHNMVHFVASDAHTCRSRSPKLSKAYGIVCSEVGLDIAERLFCRNGLAVLENRKLEADEALEVRKGIGYSLTNAMRKMFSINL